MCGEVGCGYCQQEHPLWWKFQKKYPLWASDYRDKPQNGIAMLERMGNPFILTIDDSRGEFAMQLGVDGAPETYVVDEHGMIRYVILAIWIAKRGSMRSNQNLMN